MLVNLYQVFTLGRWGFKQSLNKNLQALHLQIFPGKSNKRGLFPIFVIDSLFVPSYIREEAAGRFLIHCERERRYRESGQEVDHPDKAQLSCRRRN